MPSHVVVAMMLILPCSSDGRKIYQSASHLATSLMTGSQIILAIDYTVCKYARSTAVEGSFHGFRHQGSHSGT